MPACGLLRPLMPWARGRGSVGGGRAPSWAHGRRPQGRIRVWLQQCMQGLVRWRVRQAPMWGAVVCGHHCMSER